MTESITQTNQSIENQLAESLNKDCHCISLDRVALHQSLEAHLSESGLPEKLLHVHEHLFADSPVFLWHEHIQKMEQLIRAVEKVIHNVDFRKKVLSFAPGTARHDFGPEGVFFGYDFHLGVDGPQLIEINTNSGGVLLNHYLATAQRACCDEVINLFKESANFETIETQLINMFRTEWELQYPGRTLSTIAIVDNDPESQFLYPEFILFQSLFKRQGIETIIADPGTFTIKDKALWSGETKIDFVYNRLTDFYLENPESARLREAYENGFALFTPSPQHYSLHGDKRILPLLSDSNLLRRLGIDEETIDTLNHSLPNTVVVTKENANELWENRKRLFFKPATGYGSRGAYRGAKLTRRVWENIINSEYIAQSIIPPSERILIIDGEKQALKLDIRCVTYSGKIQQVSARLYQGQTTNMRTKGGGLATVFSIPGSTYH